MRGTPGPEIILPFVYEATTLLFASKGMEIWVYAENDEPSLEGRATVTFYGRLRSEADF